MLLGAPLEALVAGLDPVLRLTIHIGRHLAQHFYDLRHLLRQIIARKQDLLPDREFMVGHSDLSGPSARVSPHSPAPSCMKAWRNASAPARVGKPCHARIPRRRSLR